MAIVSLFSFPIMWVLTKEGLTKVTHERFIELMKEYAPKEVIERIEKE